MVSNLRLFPFIRLRFPRVISSVGLVVSYCGVSWGNLSNIEGFISGRSTGLTLRPAFSLNSSKSVFQRFGFILILLAGSFCVLVSKTSGLYVAGNSPWSKFPHLTFPPFESKSGWLFPGFSSALAESVLVTSVLSLAPPPVSFLSTPAEPKPPKLREPIGLSSADRPPPLRDGSRSPEKKFAGPEMSTPGTLILFLLGMAGESISCR